MKKIFTLLFVLLMILALTACSQEVDSASNEGIDIKQLVANHSLNLIEGEMASITSNELIIMKANGEEKTIDISEEDFFVSIAPYIHETHP